MQRKIFLDDLCFYKLVIYIYRVQLSNNALNLHKKKERERERKVKGLDRTNEAEEKQIPLAVSTFHAR